jgi:CheY-like chemotaxis protein
MAPKQIFILEDEAILLCDLEDLVRHLGYQLAGSASSVNEATALLTSGLRPDLAVLDLNLNGVASDPVADHLVAAGVPIIFVTGYGARGLPDRFADFAVLQKPYDEAQLAEALAAALKGTS